MTEYYKVQDGYAHEEPIPEVFQGLDPEDLLNPPQTDPALGLEGAMWWPGEDHSEMMQLGFDYAPVKTLTLDTERKVVIVKRELIPWSKPRLEAYKEHWIEQVNVLVAAGVSKPTRFTKEYERREAQARAYLAEVAAGSTEPAPRLIASFADSAGLPELTAAKLTVAQADDLYEKLDTLADLRMRKYEIKRATSAKEANDCFQRIKAEIEAVVATIT